MAPGRRGRRRKGIATSLRPSIETAANSKPQLSGSNHPITSLEPDETDDAQRQELETPARQTYALVLGEEMLVPQTYDPETYDAQRRMPWTPEPEPYDADTYAAWGRKHFGNDWYELRKMMLQERNIYLQYDGVYKGRQRTLRIIEHKIERRPFEPRGGWMWDEGWKRLWARLSKELGIEIPPSPTPSKDNDDGDTDLSGYSTYAPTPEPREPTPLPDDPWEELDYNRRRFNWDEERYQFERFFLREALIDGARSQHEDEPGDRQAHEKREAMESLRYVNPTRFALEQRHFQHHIDLPKKGWTREEIIAQYEADVALHEWRMTNPPPRGSGDFGEAVTPEEEAASASWRQEFDNAWIRFYGSHTPELPGRTEDYGVMELWRKGTHTRVSRQRRREALLSDGTGDASSRAEALQRIDDEEQRDLEVLERAVERAAELTEKAEKTRRLPPPQTQEDMNARFRVWDELDVPLEIQNSLARQYGFGERRSGREIPQPPATTPQPAKDTSRKTRGGRVTKNVPTHADAAPAPQRRDRQRKTYKKEREAGGSRDSCPSMGCCWWDKVKQNGGITRLCPLTDPAYRSH